MSSISFPKPQPGLPFNVYFYLAKANALAFLAGFVFYV
jgi:hypothetical protein